MFERNQRQLKSVEQYAAIDGIGMVLEYFSFLWTDNVQTTVATLTLTIHAIFKQG
jgi:hypothetical protein